jgi:hypothetical protein
MERKYSVKVQKDSAADESSSGQGQERIAPKPTKSRLMNSQTQPTNQDALNLDQTSYKPNLTQPELPSSSTEWSYFPWSQIPISPTTVPSPSTTTYPSIGWNPSYQPYNATLEPSIDSGAFASGDSFFTNPNSYNNEYNTMAGLHESDSTYTRLNSIDEQPHFDYEYGDEKVDTTNSQETSPSFENSASPLTSMTDHPKPAEQQNPSPTRKHRQPAWGHSRSRANSSSSSIATRSHLHKRRNSTDDAQLSPTATTTSLPAKMPRLLTASTHTSYSSSSIDSPFSPPAGSPPLSLAASSASTSTTRMNHNQVEKQYRNRLNSQFESLLSALPAEDVLRRGEEGDGVEPKRVSKAEVLVLAEKYIKELEKERMELKGENETLKEKVGELRRKWVESGGVLIP